MLISELDDIVEFKWRIYCPVISIFEAKTNKFIGDFCGEIFQSEEGDIHLKAMSTGSHPLIPSRLNKAGKLIKGQYKIEAYPYSATEPWIASIHFFDVSTGPSGSIITARIYKIQKTETLPAEMREATTIFLKPVPKFPLLIAQEYTKKVAARTLLHSTHDKSKLDIDNLNIEFVKDNDLLKVDIYHTDKAPKRISNFDTADKVLNGIQFILGQRVYILAQESIANSEMTKTLNSIDRSQARSILAPIARIDINDNCLKLLGVYLSYLFANEERSPKLALIINSVIETAGSSLEARCLTLAIAIEGIVNRILSKQIHVGHAFSRNEIDSIKKAATESVENNKRERISNLIDVLRQIRAKDRLYALVDSGIIEKELANSWDAIRNKAAHGGLLIAADDMQEYFNHLNRMMTLFYRLVFLAIDYKGIYTDYSIYGYPDKEFAKSLKEIQQ